MHVRGATRSGGTWGFSGENVLEINVRLGKAEDCLTEFCVYELSSLQRSIRNFRLLVFRSLPILLPTPEYKANQFNPSSAFRSAHSVAEDVWPVLASVVFGRLIGIVGHTPTSRLQSQHGTNKYIHISEPKVTIGKRVIVKDSEGELSPQTASLGNFGNLETQGPKW